MKPFTELTDQELATLDNDQVNAYIDLACAEQGIPYPPDVPPRPSGANDDAPDLSLHQVGGIFFTDRSDAENVAALISTLDRWETKYENVAGEYQSVYVPCFKAEDVTTMRVRSRAAMAKFAATKGQALAARKAYEELEKEAAHITSKRAAVGCGIYDAIAGARRTIDRRVRYQEIFDRYLKLAGGHVTVACKFFEDAYSDARDVLPAVFENNHIDPVTPARARGYGEDTAL